MTLTYILSQIFVVLCYICLAATYAIKNRYILLSVSIAAIVFNAISYTLLGAWAGLAVTIVALIRNIIFMIQEKLEGDKDYTVADWIVLVVLMLISATFAYFTYDGWLSLFSVFSSVLYTISVWQHNISVYKILGLISSICSIVYFIFIWSLFGFILEIAMFVFMLVTTIIYFVKLKKEKNKEILNG